MKRFDRRLRAKTFSGIPSEALQRVLLQVPAHEDGGDSSQCSSPETGPEPEQRIVEHKERKKQKKKKNRQPRIIKSPPECGIPHYTEEEIMKAKEISGKLYKSPYYDTPKSPTTLSPTAKLDKSSSFKKKAKPEYLERLAREHAENKENKRVSAERVKECNIVLLGDLGVGKTALAVRFVTRRYLHEYDPKLERNYEKNIQSSGEEVNVRLLDTVGKSWENYTEQAHGFIVMYSITSTHSATNAHNIVNSIRSSRNSLMKNIPILLVGNKCELEHARKVPREHPEKFALSNGCAFKEVSIACTINVDGIVKSVVKRIQAQEGGRTTPGLTPDGNGAHKTSLSRKPSNAKHIMKNFLKKKEKS